MRNRKFVVPVASLALFAALALPAVSEGAYIASSKVLSTLQSGKYGTVGTSAGTSTYLLYDPSGKTLSQSRQYQVKDGSKTLAAGVQVGESGECVSEPKALCGAGATTGWKRGKQVIGNSVQAGTAIATFVQQNGKWVYSGHATIYNRTLSDGSIECFSMNWPTNFRCISKHLIRSTGKGGVTDSRSYFVIE